ncbi:MAG: hypothetical protein IJ356_01415, partial [Erysipelotrichaceae bacterium]|nr:hypothetical protein [Erysipelotrichaceae bacterium]
PTTQQQNTNYNSGISLRDTSRTPSVKTEAVNFDDGDVSGESDEDDIDPPTIIETEDSTNQQKTDEVNETEEVTGNIEPDNIGTETKIETGENTRDFVESIYQEGVGEVVSQIFENSSKNFDDFITFIATSTGISLPSLSGQKIVYPFKETLNNMSGTAKYVAEELSKTGPNLVKYASSTVIGTAVGTAFEMLDGKDFAEALSESVVKAGVSSALMMGVVGAATLMSVTIPAFIGFGIGLFISDIVNLAYDKNTLGIQTIANVIEKDIKQDIEQTINKAKFVVDVVEYIADDISSAIGNTNY